MLWEYTIEAIEMIMSAMLLLGMMFAYVNLTYKSYKTKYIFVLGVVLGFVWAGWMAYMKNATNKIDTPTLNFWIYVLAFIAFAAFIVLSIIEKKALKLKGIPSLAALSFYIFLVIFRIFPDFLAYPYTIKVAETTVFSSSYVIKMSGVVIGFVITLVAAFAVNSLGKRIGKMGSFGLLLIMMCIRQFEMFGIMLTSMMTLRIISSNTPLFGFAVFVRNNANLFTYLTMAVAVVAAFVMLARGMHVNEPYSNPAQHRKILAKWRITRKWAATALSCVALSVVLMTAVNSVVNAEVELSPTEESTIEGDNVVVTFEQVSDGHLHRYGYTTDNDVEVRYIVIQKPNSATYGIGMDCCEICGETGYYENRAGDVVCNRCDVIMNINTIGFEGGCNPKVVKYTLDNGKIIIPISELTQYEEDFSK